MDDLSALQSMGLELPSAAYMVAAILFGIVGFVVFRRGKRLKQSQLLLTGAALMFYPYAVSQTWLVWGVGFALTGWAIFKWNSD
jgi:ABC-type Fe3+-siderophore transport system permease subunit